MPENVYSVESFYGGHPEGPADVYMKVLDKVTPHSSSPTQIRYSVVN